MLHKAQREASLGEKMRIGEQVHASAHPYKMHLCSLAKYVFFLFLFERIYGKKEVLKDGFKKEKKHNLDAMQQILTLVRWLL